VLLVTIDTLRADHVGCYGASRAHTPHLDALAAEGVRFATAVSPAPLTLPAHASLMTGLDPPAHGVRHNSIHRLDAGIPTLAASMRDGGYATAAVVGALVLDRRFGLARGFGAYDDRMGDRMSGSVGYAERTADRVVDAGLAWARAAPPRFFLWIHFYDPHTSYDPPPGFASAFSSHRYAGEIAFADAQLGRLLAGIREHWGAEGLLVLATSDHGESLAEHGELTHSYTIYEATQRIPLLMSGPGLPRGRVVEAPVRLIDVAPTLLALAGAKPLVGAGGEDLRPLIRGSEREPRVAYMETLATQLDFRWSPLLGLRTARFKYIRAPRPELYDLQADPDEIHNRASEEPEMAAALDRDLESRLSASRPPRADVDLSEQDRERLQSLGYLVPAQPLDPAVLGRVGGPDPKDEIGLLRKLAQAETLLTEGRAGEALERLEALGDAGSSVAALRAAAALAAGALTRAERDARAVLAEEPHRVDLLVLLGRVLEQRGDLARARNAFEAATRVDPASSSPLLGLGRVLERLGRSEEAARSYAAAHEANAASAEAGWRLAAVLLEAGRDEEADRILEAMAPDALISPAAALRLARAESRADRAGAARERLAAATAQHPRDPRLAMARGTLLERAGRLEEALEVREAALELAPELPAAQGAVARTLARLGRELDRALVLARQAETASGGQPSTGEALALVLLARGDAGEALQVADGALDGADAEIRGHLLFVRAAALSALGRPGAARRAADRALAAAGGEESAYWREEAERLRARVVP
jgi:arylsulfatase A-like enzyme/thioredoxin-like negative regulator of GroEL